MLHPILFESCVQIVIPDGQLGRIATSIGAASIDDHWNSLVGVEASTNSVEVELADGNSHAPTTQISKT